MIPFYSLRLSLEHHPLQPSAGFLVLHFEVQEKPPRSDARSFNRDLHLRVEDLFEVGILERMLEVAKRDLLRFVQRAKEDELKREEFLADPEGLIVHLLQDWREGEGCE